MAWIIRNETGGIFSVTDLNITFHPHQIRDMDLLGRENAEKSVQLKQLLNGQTLKEIKKDFVPGCVDPQTVDRMEKAAEKFSVAAENAQKVQEAQNQRIADLQVKNEELTKKLDESTATTNKVLEEFRAFAEKFPVQVKNIADAMRNISSERQDIAKQRDEMAGASDPEIKIQDRILALKDKKLEKNLDNLGKTISGPSTDVNDALKALDELGI
jgi:hypothetical protein